MRPPPPLPLKSLDEIRRLTDPGERGPASFYPLINLVHLIWPSFMEVCDGNWTNNGVRVWLGLIREFRVDFLFLVIRRSWGK